LPSELAKSKGKHSITSLLLRVPQYRLQIIFRPLAAQSAGVTV
jgi:hypothetical protein